MTRVVLRGSGRALEARHVFAIASEGVAAPRFELVESDGPVEDDWTALFVQLRPRGDQLIRLQSWQRTAELFGAADVGEQVCSEASEAAVAHLVMVAALSIVLERARVSTGSHREKGCALDASCEIATRLRSGLVCAGCRVALRAGLAEGLIEHAARVLACAGEIARRAGPGPPLPAAERPPAWPEAPATCGTPLGRVAGIWPVCDGLEPRTAPFDLPRARPRPVWSWVSRLGRINRVLVASDRVVAGADHGLVHLDPASGRVLRTGAPGMPVATLGDGGLVVQSGGLIGVDRSGAPRWRRPGAANRMRPTADGELAILEHAPRAGSRARLTRLGLDGRERWSADVHAAVMDDTMARDLRWTLTCSATAVSAACFGTFPEPEGAVLRYDPTSGRLLEEVPALEADEVRSSLLRALGRESGTPVTIEQLEGGTIHVPPEDARFPRPAISWPGMVQGLHWLRGRGGRLVVWGHPMSKRVDGPHLVIGLDPGEPRPLWTLQLLPWPRDMVVAGDGRLLAITNWSVICLG